MKARARLANPFPKTQAVKGGMSGGYRIAHFGFGIDSFDKICYVLVAVVCLIFHLYFFLLVLFGQAEEGLEEEGLEGEGIFNIGLVFVVEGAFICVAVVEVEDFLLPLITA